MDSVELRKSEDPKNSLRSDLNFLSLHQNIEPAARLQSAAPPAFLDFDQKSLSDLFVTDANNGFCRTFPAQGQIPVMESGGNSSGCVFGNASTDPTAYDTYKEHRAQTVKVFGDAAQGSGVMVGKDGEQCLVLTANHVIESNSSSPQPPHVSTADATNGASYPSSVQGMAPVSAADYPAVIKKRDLKNDLAVLSVSMGADADSLCKPVTVAKKLTLSPGDDLVSLGYPGLSTSVYAAPAILDGTPKLSTAMGPSANEPGALLPGENGNRKILSLDALAVPGDSGGPTFDTQGNLVGIVVRGDSYSTSFDTPVDQSKVKSMLKF